MDDGSSAEITLLIQFYFFSVPYRTIYVSFHQKLLLLHRNIKYVDLAMDEA